MNRVISQGEEVTRSAQTFTADKMEGFISEGKHVTCILIVWMPSTCTQVLSQNYQVVTWKYLIFKHIKS